MSDKIKNELISIIIVNYNGESLLSDCLLSIEQQEYKEIEIVLVDNASKDNSVELVKTKFPNVNIVQSPKNLGFAGGNNLGLQSAKGKYIVLLNNDTVVDKKWITELVKALNENDAGVVTSKVITEDVPKEFYEMNGSINYLGYNIMRVFSELSTIFFAGGASLIMRRGDSKTIFPDEYFIYQEDVFLSWKMRLQNKKVLMSQRSIVHHKGSVTTKTQLSSFSTFYQERNRILNVILFYETKTLIKIFPYFIFDFIAKILLSIFIQRKSFVGIIRSYLWICMNIPWIRKQRIELQRERKVNDSAILKYISYKIIDSENMFSKVLNQCSKLYSDIVGLDYYA